MLLQHTFLCISLRLFCTTATWDFQKLPSYTFYWGNFICGPVHVFRCRSFLTWWPLAFLIFSCTAAIKFSCYSSNEIGLLCFFISGSSSFFVIHANKDIKINSKERIGFVVVVFYLKKSGWLYDVPPNARVLEMQNFTPAYLNGWTYVGTICSEPKFLGCIDYQIFLPMVLRY